MLARKCIFCSASDYDYTIILYVNGHHVPNN